MLIGYHTYFLQMLGYGLKVPDQPERETSVVSAMHLTLHKANQESIRELT